MLHSPNASTAEKTAAELILRSAVKGKLEVHVIRTSHVLGEPTAAVLKQSSKVTETAAGLAKSTLDDFARSSVGAIESVATKIPTKSFGGKILKSTAKVAVPVAVAIDAGLRSTDAADVERRFGAGEITQEEREIAHSKNAAGMAGGWGGAAGGAWLTGEIAAPLAAMTGPAAPVC